jgi:hypothetical protein
MKKVLVLTLMLVVGYAVGSFAVSYGDVKDNNDGIVGQLLVNTGINSGSADVGTWVDPTSIPSLKGDKGDTGDTGAIGATGPQGEKGDAGAIGPQGDPGKDGTNGTNGANGVDGAKGDTGDKGDKGDQGLQGIQGIKGDLGLTGAPGKDVDPVTVNKINNKLDNHEARLNNLENAVHEQGETKVLIEGAVRLYDSKRFEFQAFNSYDARHGQNFSAGVRLLFKVGKSYEERLFEKQNRDLQALEMRLSRLQEGLPVVQAPATIWFVSSNGEVQKTLPKDPRYIKALLETKNK